VIAFPYKGIELFRLGILPFGTIGAGFRVQPSVLNSIRVTVLLVALAAGAGAFGQLTGPEADINNALIAARTNLNMAFQLSGVRQTGSDVEAIDTDVYFSLVSVSANTLAKVEIDQSIGGKPTTMVIGDGLTLWRYDYPTNTYSALQYGAYNGAPPVGYADAVLKSLQSLVSGQSAQAVGLLREIYEGLNAQYTSWMPGVTPTSTWAGSTETVNYSTAIGNPRALRFTIAAGQLSTIGYSESETAFGLTRITQWVMSIYPGNTLTAPSGFVFNMPAGAKPVVGSLKKID